MIKPLVLTFIAPADRCNQACPDCILSLAREPVTQFDLKPCDYAKFAGDFRDAGLPIGMISFQGYEVTLPKSWPYVEAVFHAFQNTGVELGFVTNGMLIHRYAERVQSLNVSGFTVSIDGAHDAVNDRLRGLKGALRATTRSLRQFLDKAPEYKERIDIASVIYGDVNAEALYDMPKLIKDLGLGDWTVGSVLEPDDDGRMGVNVRWDIIEKCYEAAMNEGVSFTLSDEIGRLDCSDYPFIPVSRLPDPDGIFRLLPSGDVRCFGETFNPIDESIPKWDGKQNVLEYIYRYKMQEPGRDDARLLAS